MKHIVLSIMMLSAIFSGCSDDITDAVITTGAEPKTNITYYYLCVGMENSKRFGACPGCEQDAQRMQSLLKDKYGYNGDILISEEATKSAVVGKLKKAVDLMPPNGLLLFCYSGHGGQEWLGGKEPDGSDREDEFLCLYDTYMLDDEIWDIVSKCKGRVFLYFDACHSATMYRSVAAEVRQARGEAVALDSGFVKTKGFNFRIEDYLPAEAMSSDSTRAAVPRILCWSGCKETEYSYGGYNGGVMTRNLIHRWTPGISYASLWDLVVSGVQREQPTQHPVQTRMGAGFADGTEAFR